MSRQRSWSVCLAAIVAAWFVGLACPSALAQSSTPAPVLKPVVVVLTSGTSDALRCMMALGLAESALNAGREVAVYLDVNAPELAKRDKSGKPFTPGRRTSSAKDMGAGVDSQKMLTALMAKGAKVYVCPMCMKYLKTTSESLLDGITALTDKELLDLTSDATVLSY